MTLTIIFLLVLGGGTPDAQSATLQESPGRLFAPDPEDLPIRGGNDAPLPRRLVLWEEESVQADLPGAARTADPQAALLPPSELRLLILEQEGSRKQEHPPQEGVPAPHDFSPPPGASGWEAHVSAKAWREYVWGDYLTQPAVLLPLGLGATAAIISHWDKTLQQHWFGVLGNKGWYSDAGQYTLIAAVILDGLLLPGEGRNSYDQAWNIGESYAASSLTTYVLKATVKRPRPGAGSESGVGTHSFPSGHSQSAFTAATLIEANSGPALGLPAYGLAGFTAFERVEEGRHFPSDVFAGAAIGTLSAGIFDALHWGSGTQGGIARPETKLALDMDGLKGFTLSLAFKF